MKTLQNPTNFFFQQSNNPPTEYKEKIQEFVSKLINLKNCVLCKESYDFQGRIPRILVHCGHTFCTNCLRNFYRNMRIRCPLCLKLIKNLETIERLPVNHTIFTAMAEELNEKNRQRGEEEIDLQAALYAQFEASQKTRQNQQPQQQNQQYMYDEHMGGQPGQPMGCFDPHYQNFMGQMPANMKGVVGVNPRIDPDTGLEWCQYHNDRVKHFFCNTHRDTCCRMCSAVLHGKADCMVFDLYEIDDMHQFLNEFQQKGGPTLEGENDTKKKTKYNQQQFQEEIFGNGMNDDQDQDLDDDANEQVEISDGDDIIDVLPRKSI